MQPLYTVISSWHAYFQIKYSSNIRRESVQMYSVLADHNKPTNAQNMQRAADPEHGLRKHSIQE